MRDLKRILIVRTDRMGDVVLTTPSVRALRKAYPQAYLVMLVTPQTKALIEGNKYLDEILIDDRKNEHRGAAGFFRLVKTIKKKNFDAAVVFHTKKRTNALCFFSGIPYRVGYKNKKFGFLLTDPIVDTRHLGIKHEVEYCLDVLRHMGIKDDGTAVDIALNASSERWAEDLFASKDLCGAKYIVAIHPGSSDQVRTWSKENFIELTKQMANRYSCKILVIGDPSLSLIAEEMVITAPGKVVSLVGKTNLSQLVSVLKRCHNLISTDSGPVHVAAGLNTPVLSIFTRILAGVNPERWRPLNSRSKAVVLIKDPSSDIPSRELQLLQIQEVLEAVDQIFKLC